MNGLLISVVLTAAIWLGSLPAPARVQRRRRMVAESMIAAFVVWGLLHW